MKYVGIFNKFFGRKPNQTLTEFSAEIKELNDDERDELATLAATELGVVYEPPEKGT